MNLFKNIFPFFRLNCEWTDYYSNGDTYQEVTNRDQLFSKTDGQNYYVSQSMFSGLNSRAVYISYQDFPILLIESTTINECSSSDNNQGGSIFFNGNSIVFSKSCILKSNMFGTNKDGTAAYFECKNSDQSKNHVLFSSVFQNADQTADSKTTLTLQKGSVFLNHFNFTNNKCISSGLLNILGSHNVWINNTLFIQNTIDQFPNNIQYSANFYQFTLSNNECSYNNNDKYMFTIQNCDSHFVHCYLQENSNYHEMAFYIGGSNYLSDTYYCCGFYTQGSNYMNNLIWGCPDTPPGIEIPVVNYCFTNDNSNQIRKADIHLMTGVGKVTSD